MFKTLFEKHPVTVWHPDSPGVSLVVQRSQIDALFKPADFATLYECIYQEWAEWFAWYPVCTFEYGWVWFRPVSRKIIPAGFPVHGRSTSLRLSQLVTGCWHRVVE